VLCSGIIYGNEEIIFRDHFKSAWLEDPPSLMYIGEGENLLPTIHMRDLAKICKFYNESKPEE